MPRREILLHLSEYSCWPSRDDEGELIRRDTLTKADLAFVAGELSSTLFLRWAADEESPSSVPTFA